VRRWESTCNNVDPGGEDSPARVAQPHRREERVKLVFKFVGGPLDGKTVVGRRGQQDEADRYFALSNHAQLGQQFRVASQYAVETLASEELQEQQPHHFQQHQYRITDRLEDHEKVFVRAEYQ
jgi:hypothetical protein